MTYQLTTLPGGLRVASESLPGVESATVAVTVDVGARFERENEGGLSHLLEHMAFKGTKRRTARQIAEEMDMIGGHMNAYTSMENTVYYAKVLADDVPLAVDMLADILQHSTFDQDELARERDVILQEIAMHHDTPDDLVFDYFSETAYPAQPLGRSILGQPEQVEAYQSAELEAYMRQNYSAHNMVVTAAGKIDHERFVAMVGEQFAHLPTHGIVAPESGKYMGGDRRTPRKLEQLHLMLGIEGVSFHHADYYAWQILATILGGGMSSRLFQEVREKRGLAYTVQAFVSSYADSGVLGIYAATAEEKGPEMLPVLCDEMLGMATKIDPLELARARNQIKANLLMSRESSSAIAEWIGKHLLCYGRYRPADEIAGLIDAVTGADILRIAGTFTGAASPTLATLGPQKRLPDYASVKAQFAA